MRILYAMITICCLATSSLAAQSFCSDGPITIPKAPNTSGKAHPYPQSIVVSGQQGTMMNLAVKLKQLSHTNPDDLDIMLVGPNGTSVILMSDAGGSHDISEVDLTFRDSASGMLPDSDQIVSGSYKPTNYGMGDVFSAPAPASGGSSLGAFNGSDPNGTWYLYVMDDSANHTGSLCEWCLEFETQEHQPEIEVGRDGHAIIDGGFDDVPCPDPCGETGTLTYIISNIGDGDLVLQLPVDISEEHNVSATVTDQPDSVIPPGGSTTMVISYTPQGAGPFSFMVSICNNDCDENPFNWCVRGFCEGEPEIEVWRGEREICDGAIDEVECPEPCGTTGTLTYLIKNTGDGNLTIDLPVTISNQMNVVAVVTQQPASLVLPGASTTLKIDFTPQGGGFFSFEVSFGNNDEDENPFNWCVKGFCPGEPEMDVFRDQQPIADGGIDDVDCPEPCGTTGTLTYIIENNGDGDLILGPAVISSQMNVSAVVTTQPSSPVPAGGSATLVVDYTPLMGGNFSFLISIANNDENENPYNWCVRGFCEGEPEIEVRRGQIYIQDGGIDEVDCPDPCGVSGTLTYVIRNTGDGNLILNLPVTISSQHNVSASVTTQPSSPILPGGSSAMVITFTPQNAGIFSFIVSIGNNDDDENPFNWCVRGFCEGTPEMDVFRDDKAIADGGIDEVDCPDPCGETGSLTYIIENNGSGNLTLGPASISNQMNVVAVVTSQPVSPVVPGGATSMTVEYTPQGAGMFSFIVTIPNNDENENPYNWCVRGECEGEPEMDVYRGTQPIADGSMDQVECPDPCGTSGTLTYIIQNNGDGNLTLGPATISHEMNVSATVTTQPSSPVLPGASTVLVVEFTPQGGGEFSFEITIPNNDENENPYNWCVVGHCEGEPEMDVFRDGRPIADGGFDHVDCPEPCGTTGTLTYIIKNTGDGNLILGPATISHQMNVSAFVVTQPSSPVVPGGSTFMVVSFTPQGGGEFSFQVNIPNNDENENPYTWCVEGECEGEPEMKVKRGEREIEDGGIDEVDCPMPCGEAEGTLLYVIKNNGDGDLILNLPVTISGQMNVTATVTTQPTSPVPPGGSTAFIIKYMVMGGGEFSFLVSIGNNDANENPYNWCVKGFCEAEDAPEIAVFRGSSAITDGGTDHVTDCVPGQQQTLTYTIRNLGTATLELYLPVSAPGSQSNVSASIAGQPSALVAAGGSTTLTVNYTPSSADPFSFTLSIGNNDANEDPYNWTVTGDCSGGSQHPEMDLFRGASAIADGGVDTVTDCEMCVEKQLTYTIRNTGTANLLLDLPVAAPGNQDQVLASIASQPSATVAPGGSTTLVVNYTPLNDNPFSFTLSIGSNDANENPYNWTVQGDCSNTSQAPEVSVTRQSMAVLDNGSDALGNQSVGAHTVTYRIHNTGSSALTLNGAPDLVALTAGSNVSGLSVTSQPASTIPAGGFADFTVAYTVDAEGPFSFNVSLANNDSDENPYNFTVSGNGSSEADADIAVTRGSLELADGGTDDLGSIEAGEEIVLTYEIRNVGDANLALDLPVNVSATSNVAVAVSLQPSANIAGGGSSTLVITLTPLAEGPFAAEVRIDSNDADEDPFSWTISGTATPEGSNGGGIDVGVDDVEVNCSAGETSTGLWMLFIMVSVSMLAARALRFRR